MRAMVEERRAAKRMWDGGMARKVIARHLNVKEGTIKDWRYRDQWEPRTGNGHEHRDSGTYRPKTFRKPEMRRVLFACPKCGTRATAPEGHSACHEEHGRAA